MQLNPERFSEFMLQFKDTRKSSFKEEDGTPKYRLSIEHRKMEFTDPADPQTLVITNTGTELLEIVRVLVVGHFQASGYVPDTFSNGEFFELSVVFEPKESNHYSGYLQVFTNPPVEHNIVYLEGVKA